MKTQVKPRNLGRKSWPFQDRKSTVRLSAKAKSHEGIHKETSRDHVKNACRSLTHTPYRGIHDILYIYHINVYIHLTLEVQNSLKDYIPKSCVVAAI